jgi:hypothetical protein
MAGPQAYAADEIETLPPDKPKGDCVIPIVPLRKLLKPGRKND